LSKGESSPTLVCSKHLTPIACKFCKPPDRLITYNEFDLVLHLSEVHGIGRGYLDMPPTPSKPSRSWSSDYRIRDAIDSGKRLGRQLDENCIQKLDLEYSKCSEKTPPQACPSIHAEAYGDNILKGIRTWSQLRVVHTKNSFTFIPVLSIDEFFKDDHDKPYSALPSHSLEQSPCYPIIGIKPAGRHIIMYYCEICRQEFANDPAVANINLSSIEHHCKYKDPERHKAEILARLKGWLK
jgi:hypothetical protein